MFENCLLMYSEHFCKLSLRFRVVFIQLKTATQDIVDSLPQALLEGRPAGSLLLTPQQLQQLQRLQAAQEQGGGALTLTLQQGGGSGVGPQLVLAPQSFLSGATQPSTEHILHTGHTSIQHVLQSSISHVRQASILQSSLQPIPASSHSSQVSCGEVRTHDVATSGECKVVGATDTVFSTTAAPAQHILQATHQPQALLQLFHQQAARGTVQNQINAFGTQMGVKAKQPPQILPKPVGTTNPVAISAATCKPTHTPSQAVSSMANQPTGTLLFNQVLPNGAVLVQQQTSSGVQFILKSPTAPPQPKPGLVIANGGIQPQTVIVQGRTQAHQVLRLVPGQMQFQQIHTSSGPTLIAVPSTQVPKAATVAVSQPQTNLSATATLTSLAVAAASQKKPLKKKKKKEDESPRLDLANLIKISGIEDDDSVVSHGHHQVQVPQPQQPSVTSTPGQPNQGLVVQSASRGTSTNASSPRPSTPKGLPASSPTIQSQPQSQSPAPPKQLHQTVQLHQAQQNTQQLLTQLNPSQVGGGGLRLSVGEDGTMVVHQAEQQTTVTPSVAAAAQSQLAQLIADHGGQILHTNAGMSNSSTKEAAFMQSLQTAVLQLSGTSGEGMVLKSNNLGTPVMVNSGMRRASTGGVVVTPTIPQNGMRLVTDLNGLGQQQQSSGVSLTEHNRLIVSGIAANVAHIVTGVPTSAALSLEQQNHRIIVTTPTTMLTQHQNSRVIVSNVDNQQTQRLLVTNSPTVSLTEQNRVIVQNIPSNLLASDQNRVQIVSDSLVSGVQGADLSLTEQNRVQILSGMSEQQNRVQILSGVQNSNTLALSEQNRLQILSNVQNPNLNMSLTEKQNLVQIVNSNLSVSEQNKVQVVASVAGSVPQLQDQGRFKIINSLANSKFVSDQNKIQVVQPSSNTVIQTDSSQLQNSSVSVPCSTSELGRLHLFDHTANGLTLATDQSVELNPNQAEPNRIQLAARSIPEKVQVVSSCSLLTSDYRFKTTSPAQTNVQIVSALVNNDRINNQDNKTFTNPNSGVRFQQYIRPNEMRLISHVVKEKDLELNDKDVQIESHGISDVRLNSVGSGHEDNRLQYISHNNQVVPQNNVIRPHGGHSVQSEEEEERCGVKSPCLPPQSPLGTLSSFNNRPNLTVVPQPPRVADPGGPKAPLQPHQPQPPLRRSYDNAFLDSIAQSHPSIVINKPTSPNSAKLIKMKKPVKKAALVKPMMAEDRIGSDKEDASNLVPIGVTTDHGAMISRVQTIQLTPQKQQQLKQIQAQIQPLSCCKARTPAEDATLQRLLQEQQKILLGGKLVSTVPGQHAQGLAFVSGASAGFRLVPACTKLSTPPSSTDAQTQSVAQPPTPTSHANKATSPIHVQQVSTQTLPPPPVPSQPIFSRARRATMIDQQYQADIQGALGPDTNSPFSSKSDAVKRLLRYHTLNEPVLSEKDLAKADELFEQTARHLLDKKNLMYNKFSYLILKESMRLHATSELVLLGRLFSSDESSMIEQMKVDALSQPSPSGNSSGTVFKREREEPEPFENKKHCPDDEEINAQVQSAIDSILNLQRNDPLEEAVRSITS